MKFAGLPTLSHPLVVLRPLTAADIQTWYDYLSLPEVYGETSWNLQSSTELEPYVWREEAFTPSSMLRFAIALRSSNQLVGTAGFHTVVPVHRTAEIAYDLSPLVWGKGIATAACQVLVNWAHASANVNRVQATILESNERSIRVIERAGFNREGLLHAYRMLRDRPGNFHMYAHVQTAA
ncbi:MAG: GNAT family N-acetyltransferase [Ideonella sp.]|nr:GNAT family N-acetyltransferase [Ideonella sp.]